MGSPLDFYGIALLVLNTISFVLFLYISIFFTRSYLRAKIESLGFFSLSFILLTLSRLISAVSTVLEDPKLSLAMHTLSSSTASAAFLIMLFSIRFSEREEVFIVVPPLIALSFPDLISFVLSLVTSLLVKGKYLKNYILMLSITFLLRGVGSLLMLTQLGLYLIIFSEFLMALATLLFALYHLKKVIVV